MANISVVTINMNDWPNTSACLDSLRKVDYEDVRIIVVDNGSWDGSDERIVRSYPEIIFIKNNANLGYSRANNQGIAKALARGTDFVFVLNNDAVVAKDIFSKLVVAHRQIKGDVILGCKIMSYAEPQMIQSCGCMLRKEDGDIDSFFIGGGEVDRGQHDTVKECDFISGCAIFVTKRLIEKIGMLDEEIFAVWEDTDFGIRNKCSGGKNYTIPRAKVFHKGDGSTRGKPHPWRYYLNARNKLYLLSKHHDYFHADMEAVEGAMMETYHEIMNSGYELRRTAAHALKSGIKDFHRGRFGKFPKWLQKRQEQFLEYRLRIAKERLSRAFRNFF